MILSSLGAIDSTIYLLLGLLCLVLFGVALVRRAQLNGVTLREATRTERARLREQLDVHRSLEELLPQLDELSRRIDTQTETQIARLETAIAAADRRIAQLDATREQRGPAGAPQGPAATSDSAGRDMASRRRQVYELSDSGTGPIAIAERLRIPLGDVELLLNVRRFERSAGH